MKISPDEFAHLQIATSKQPGPAQVIGCPAAVGSQMQIRHRLMSAEIDIEIQRSMRYFAYNLGKFARSRRFALLCAGWPVAGRLILHPLRNGAFILPRQRSATLEVETWRKTFTRFTAHG